MYKNIQLFLIQSSIFKHILFLETKQKQVDNNSRVQTHQNVYIIKYDTT